MRILLARACRRLPIAFVMMLLIVLPAAQVLGQAPPTGALWVTYVNATPTTTSTGNALAIVFRVVQFAKCDPYLGSIAQNATGIKSATFLLVSVLTQQSKEYPNTPVYPTGREGEYRGDIQIAGDDPTGKVWVYVEGMSLSLSIIGGELVGPPINTGSEQTYDTSDLSLIDIAQPSAPSSWDQFLAGYGLWVLLLAALLLLLLAVFLLTRRRKKPTA